MAGDDTGTSDRFLYLTTTGRVSGLPRTIEIWFVEDAGRYYVVAERREEAQWVKNIEHDPAWMRSTDGATGSWWRFFLARRGQRRLDDRARATSAPSTRRRGSRAFTWCVSTTTAPLACVKAVWQELRDRMWRVKVAGRIFPSPEHAFMTCSSTSRSAEAPSARGEGSCRHQSRVAPACQPRRSRCCFATSRNARATGDARPPLACTA